MPILCSVRAILRPMRLLQEHNVWPVQLQPNKEFGVEGRREAATIVTHRMLSLRLWRRLGCACMGGLGVLGAGLTRVGCSRDSTRSM